MSLFLLLLILVCIPLPLESAITSLSLKTQAHHPRYHDNYHHLHYLEKCHQWYSDSPLYHNYNHCQAPPQCSAHHYWHQPLLNTSTTTTELPLPPVIQPSYHRTCYSKSNKLDFLFTATETPIVLLLTKDSCSMSLLALDFSSNWT